MQTLNKVLDMARGMCSRDSDRALAQALKVTPTTILGWRNGSRRITDEHLMAVIEKAKADPALAVLIRQETAETKAEKKGWATLWDRLSAAAAVLVLVVVAMPGVARAKAIEIKGLDQGNAAVCILCSDHLGVAGTSLAAAPAPTLAWSLIVRDRKLTGPWAGFSFKGGRLVTPEGRELEPQDLAWLSLTAAQAQEWRRMMESGRAIGKPRKPLSFNAASVVKLSDALAQRREKRSSGGMAGPDAEPPAAVLPVPGPKRRQRV
ncbi:DUF3693 domain-containing protein [Stenotrophomonas maltophilia]|uniref:DUF3693 domain-containing protein n=1 Tax=Stenotrophomonas maltophilia TaxID=40324 RepID=UPI001E461FC8|nr:DUF3693 domain-containing protein [Stenotrophomonas maltophilia]